MKGKEKTLPATPDTANRPVEAKKKPGKLFVILSYALALASLIAMLFVPLFEGKMFIQYLLTAVAPVAELIKVDIPASAYGTFFTTAEFGLPLSVMILCVMVSVVIALILLIPVIAGKAAKGTNLRCAFAGEIIAFICIAVYTACDLHVYLAGWNKYSLLIALGVLALVMAAQAIKYKGWLGTTRFIIFLLALVTLFTLYDIVLVIPALEAPLLSLSGMIGAYDKDVTYIGTNPYGLNGVYAIVQLCQGQAVLGSPADIVPFICGLLTIIIPTLVVISVIIDVIGLVAGKKCTNDGTPNPHKGWFVFATVRYLLILVLIAATVVLSFVLQGFAKVGIYMYFTAVAILLSFIVAIIGYCVGKAKVKAYKKQKEQMLRQETFVIKDESLEEPKQEAVEEKVVAEDYQTNMFGDAPSTAVAPVAEEVVEEQPTKGEGEQLSIMDAQPVEEAAEVVPVDEIEEPVVEEVETVEPVEEVAPVEEAVAEPAAVEEVVEEQPEEAPVHTVNLFGEEIEEEKPADEARIDPFVDKLNDEERAQFFDVFVNRNKGKIGTIPVYRLNENNADFFPAVFVHINRTRRLCSDSLLAKIYREIGKD